MGPAACKNTLLKYWLNVISAFTHLFTPLPLEFDFSFFLDATQKMLLLFSATPKCVHELEDASISNTPASASGPNSLRASRLGQLSL